MITTPENTNESELVIDEQFHVLEKMHRFPNKQSTFTTVGLVKFSLHFTASLLLSMQRRT